jgi:hypothetical protein
LSVKPLAVWREEDGRAACEEVIKELDAGYGLPQLACKTFGATEAVLAFGVLAHNPVVLFERNWLSWYGICNVRIEKGIRLHSCTRRMRAPSFRNFTSICS